MYYNNKREILQVREKENSIFVITDDGKNRNELQFCSNGDLFLDGSKIVVNTEEIVPLHTIDKANTVWKSVKSLSPIGGLSPMDYNKYLSSGKQNIKLGLAMDQLTGSALAAVIRSFKGYEGICESILDLADSLLNVLVSINPKSYHIGCYYQTYTHGAYDYKYYNRFYTNQECVGEYDLRLSYERFTVY